MNFATTGPSPNRCFSCLVWSSTWCLVDSVSKRYSMCGARIGAMVTKNKAVRKAAMKFAMARLSPPTLAQIASEAALKTSEAYFEAGAKPLRGPQGFPCQGT